MRAHVKRATRLQGSTTVPGDKSVSHRALLFSALADGRCDVENLSPGADVRSTAQCLQRLGVSMELAPGRVVVQGVGLSGLRTPTEVLDCGNSGTTMRLLAGVVAGARLAATLDGDESLRGRPMRRVLAPLREMGALATGRKNEKGEEYAPLVFQASPALQGKAHVLAVSSAQVKSCLLLAGLFAEGETSVQEPEPSRDHTERMLRALGAPLHFRPDGAVIVRRPNASLRAPAHLVVPGDPSSAAFLVAAGLLVPGADITVEGVDVNPTRTGFLRALQRMGANVSIEGSGERAGDPIATLRVQGQGGAKLRGIEIGGAEIPALVDEVPLLAILATQAQGTTTIRGASELRVKESDRLREVALGLRKMGAQVEELPDGLVIEGPSSLRGAHIDAARDHRIAMGFTVAGLCADGETTIDGAEWADISYPGFFRLLAELTGGAVDTQGS